jgi:hypothetical protein
MHCGVSLKGLGVPTSYFGLRSFNAEQNLVRKNFQENKGNEIIFGLHIHVERSFGLRAESIA